MIATRVCISVCRSSVKVWKTSFRLGTLAANMSLSEKQQGQVKEYIAAMSNVDTDIVQKGSILEEFKEAGEIKSIIASIPDIFKTGTATGQGYPIAVERAIERFIFIVDQYQEQPHLLDPHLENIIAQILDIAKNKDVSGEARHVVFKLFYLITKTRGYKIIVRLMPHEVADLEPVLTLLEKRDRTDFMTWETRYMLLLWLSMVTMIPFDMSRLDSTARAQGAEGMKPTMDRIIDEAKKYLDVCDKSQDAASYMLSRFLTRHDVRDKKLAGFLDSSLKSLKEANTKSMKGTMCLIGIMRTLALLFKHGKREDLLCYAGTVLSMVTNPDLKLKDSSNTVVRKLAVKLIHRLGLTFLKAKVAAWRYQRGNRSLADTLTTGSDGSQDPKQTEQEEDEEYDIPDEIEEVVEQLLIGLKDKDTVVRWSAAKGIGRVLGRLPRDLADEVGGSIMELFSSQEGDTAWHGGCLALAELGRRGLLLPHRLPEVVPIILKALVYDEMRGNFSVGAHVRDAACYVCWAFARAYDPDEIKLYVNKIATALVIVSVFDREVNVRRAAAAAFQENVGRQGQFPHGIDILTTCDYFAVGNRTACFLVLSVFVAQFPEYTKALVDHLTGIKMSHWDKAVRELSAEALYNLTQKAPAFMACTVLPQVVRGTTSSELTVRHGSILAAACITHALATIRATAEPHVQKVVKIDDDTLHGLKTICTKLRDAKLYRGMGGELMREAVCYLIKKLSLSHSPFHSDSVLEIWQETIDDCLQHNQEDIRAAAVDAIPAFFTEYYKQEDGKAKPDAQEKVLSRYVGQLESSVEVVRQGFALALGSLPAFMVQGHLHRVLTALMQASVNTATKGKNFSEAHRDAIKALSSLCLTVGVNKTGNRNDCVCVDNIDDIYGCLLQALKDYTMDNRGDVGACVREAAMTGIHDVTSMIIKADRSLISDKLCLVVFQSLVQQACEKIDRTRSHAGQIFIDLLYHEPRLKNIPRQDELEKIFPEFAVKQINWANPKNTFPRFIRLLAFPEYAYHVLVGISVSIGGLTESLVKSSAEALRDHIRQIMYDREVMEQFGSALIKVFRDHQRIDRVTVPFLKMLDQILAIGCFSILLENEGSNFGRELYSVCKEEIARSGDPQKILASVDVFAGMLIFSGPIQKQTIFQLMVFLCHRYPIVRKTTANKLYEAIVTFDSIVPEENLDDVMTVLSETEWDKPVEEIRPIRNELCDAFGVNRPVFKAKAAPPNK